MYQRLTTTVSKRNLLHINKTALTQQHRIIHTMVTSTLSHKQHNNITLNNNVLSQFVDNTQKSNLSTTSSNMNHNDINITSKHLPNIPLVQNTLKHLNNTAIQSNNQSYTYKQLITDSLAFKQYILDLVNKANNTSICDLQELSISYLYEGSYEYVVIQWGIWLAGGISIPLHSSLPVPQQQYIVQNSQSKLLFIQNKYYDKLKDQYDNTDAKIINLNVFDIVQQYKDKINTTDVAQIDMSRRAMLIYTSGTTGNPKGVVSTHSMIDAQTTSLVKAWQWQSNDHILHVLPLHHVHGVINALACPLYVGAKVTFVPKFDAIKVWNMFKELNDLTVFTAVPTIYTRLIHQYDNSDNDTQQQYRDSCKHFRLFMCGSAALPDTVFNKWKQISNHTLLERYGMTEVGMALSNSINENERKISSVGKPLPYVQTKLLPQDDDDSSSSNNNTGQLLLKGPTVFSEYYNMPDATKKEFTEDGWFKTGDIVRIDDNGYYYITGRASVDIIKSGGNKISALAIESVLLTHDSINEVAVCGVSDNEYGQVVGVIAVLHNNKSLTLDELKQWSKTKLQTAETPRKLLIVDSIPRNAMGKINKKQLVKLFDKQ